MDSTADQMKSNGNTPLPKVLDQIDSESDVKPNYDFPDLEMSDSPTNDLSAQTSKSDSRVEYIVAAGTQLKQTGARQNENVEAISAINPKINNHSRNSNSRVHAAAGNRNYRDNLTGSTINQKQFSSVLGHDGTEAAAVQRSSSAETPQKVRRSIGSSQSGSANRITGKVQNNQDKKLPLNHNETIRQESDGTDLVQDSKSQFVNKRSNTIDSTNVEMTQTNFQTASQTLKDSDEEAHETLNVSDQKVIKTVPQTIRQRRKVNSMDGTMFQSVSPSPIDERSAKSFSDEKITKQSPNYGQLSNETEQSLDDIIHQSNNSESSGDNGPQGANNKPAVTPRKQMHALAKSGKKNISSRRITSPQQQRQGVSVCRTCCNSLTRTIQRIYYTIWWSITDLLLPVLNPRVCYRTIKWVLNGVMEYYEMSWSLLVAHIVVFATTLKWILQDKIREKASEESTASLFTRSHKNTSSRYENYFEWLSLFKIILRTLAFTFALFRFCGTKMREEKSATERESWLGYFLSNCFNALWPASSRGSLALLFFTLSRLFVENMFFVVHYWETELNAAAAGQSLTSSHHSETEVCQMFDFFRSIFLKSIVMVGLYVGHRYICNDDEAESYSSLMAHIYDDDINDLSGNTINDINQGSDINRTIADLPPNIARTMMFSNVADSSLGNGTFANSDLNTMHINVNGANGNMQPDKISHTSQTQQVYQGIGFRSHLPSKNLHHTNDTNSNFDNMQNLRHLTVMSAGTSTDTNIQSDPMLSNPVQRQSTPQHSNDNTFLNPQINNQTQNLNWCTPISQVGSQSSPIRMVDLNLNVTGSARHQRVIDFAKQAQRSFDNNSIIVKEKKISSGKTSIIEEDYELSDQMLQKKKVSVTASTSRVTLTEQDQILENHVASEISNFSADSRLSPIDQTGDGNVGSPGLPGNTDMNMNEANYYVKRDPEKAGLIKRPTQSVNEMSLKLINRSQTSPKPKTNADTESNQLVKMLNYVNISNLPGSDAQTQGKSLSDSEKKMAIEKSNSDTVKSNNNAINIDKYPQLSDCATGESIVEDEQKRMSNSNLLQSPSSASVYSENDMTLALVADSNIMTWPGPGMIQQTGRRGVNDLFPTTSAPFKNNLSDGTNSNPISVNPGDNTGNDKPVSGTFASISNFWGGMNFSSAMESGTSPAQLNSEYNGNNIINNNVPHSGPAGLQHGGLQSNNNVNFVSNIGHANIHGSTPYAFSATSELRNQDQQRMVAGTTSLNITNTNQYHQGQGLQVHSNHQGQYQQMQGDPKLSTTQTVGPNFLVGNLASPAVANSNLLLQKKDVNESEKNQQNTIFLLQPRKPHQPRQLWRKLRYCVFGLDPFSQSLNSYAQSFAFFVVGCSVFECIAEVFVLKTVNLEDVWIGRRLITGNWRHAIYLILMNPIESLLLAVLLKFVRDYALRYEFDKSEERWISILCKYVSQLSRGLLCFGLILMSHRVCSSLLAFFVTFECKHVSREISLLMEKWRRMNRAQRLKRYERILNTIAYLDEKLFWMIHYIFSEHVVYIILDVVDSRCVGNRSRNIFLYIIRHCIGVFLSCVALWNAGRVNYGIFDGIWDFVVKERLRLRDDQILYRRELEDWNAWLEHTSRFSRVTSIRLFWVRYALTENSVVLWIISLILWPILAKGLIGL